MLEYADDASTRVHVLRTPLGFSLHYNPRTSVRGGGVIFMISDMFSVEVFQSPQYWSFEALCILVKNSYIGVSANVVCTVLPEVQLHFLMKFKIV